jgi:peptidyl-prolyl cis-trans isomerase A (cyclophilin A)
MKLTLASVSFRATALACVAALLLACRASAPPHRGPAQALDLGSKPQAVAEPSPAPPPAQVPPQPEPAAAPEAPPDPSSPLINPRLANLTAPERFTVSLQTTKGELQIDVRRSWAPHGADRFYSLVRAGYFDGNVFFRVIDGFVAQLGIHGDPAVNRAWRSERIPDDPVKQSNVAGMVSFAASGKNSRTTQLFINLSDNPQLDAMGFAPIGRVREIATARTLHSGYGEGAPSGRGPLQARIQSQGNAYLHAEFPQLDSVKQATVIDEKFAPPAAPARP